MANNKTDSIKRRREVFKSLFTDDGLQREHLNEALPLSTEDVAALFQMSERTIRLWAAKGALPHIRTLGGGRILYPAEQIATLYTEHYLIKILHYSRSDQENDKDTKINKS